MDNVKTRNKRIIFSAVFVIILVTIFIIPQILSRTNNKKFEEKAEYKVSSWESQAEELHKFFEKDRRDIGEDILKDIEECELEFTDEQQKRIDIVIQKIEAILSELEESEGTSSIESDSSDGG